MTSKASFGETLEASSRPLLEPISTLIRLIFLLFLSRISSIIGSKGDEPVQKYIWEHPDWPNFVYRTDECQQALYQYAREAGALIGNVAHLQEEDKTAALIDLMVAEAVRTSQIEGENLDRQDVRSSIRNQLGLNPIPEPVRDPRANGISALMISARQKFNTPLDDALLFNWHDMVIADKFLRERIPVGQYRDEPMQIVSGAIGHERVHYNAPPADRVPEEMQFFITWFNDTAPGGKLDTGLPGPIRAAVAHLYFECIHPFADGNGRIGRAIAEIALSQDLASPVLLSLSTTIQAEREQYYEALAQASRHDLDITEWINYFVGVVLKSQLQSKLMIDFVLEKARFWDRFNERLNERQSRVITRMFQEGLDGFQGGISAKKYVTITGTSKATATRDLAELLEIGAIRQLPGGGRNTRYELAITNKD